MKEQPKKRSRVEQFYDKFREGIASSKMSKEDNATQKVKRFYGKFRQVVTHHGKSRKAIREGGRGQGRRYRGSIDAQNNGRRKAKTKTRNRRNRKLTRALHQRERR